MEEQSQGTETAVITKESTKNDNDNNIKQKQRFTIYNQDAEDFLKQQPPDSIDCIFTSPDPITSWAELMKILEILGFWCSKVLKPTGSMWVHMEDRYTDKGSLARWPALFSIEMIQRGWILRAERIWHSPVAGQNFYNDGLIIDNNRLILDHCYVFHFTWSRHDYYNSFADFGGQPCSIFTEKQEDMPANNYEVAFSLELVKQSLLMSCPNGGTVMDPFSGSGTTGAVALSMKDRNYTFIGVEKDATRVIHSTERLQKIV